MPRRSMLAVSCDWTDLDKQLIGRLVDRVDADGLQLTGEGGLLAQLTKTFVEAAAEGEGLGCADARTRASISGVVVCSRATLRDQ